MTKSLLPVLKKEEGMEGDMKEEREGKRDRKGTDLP